MKIDYRHEYYNRQSRRDSALICAVCGLGFVLTATILLIVELLKG
jgi:hypothetical protein